MIPNPYMGPVGSFTISIHYKMGCFRFQAIVCQKFLGFLLPFVVRPHLQLRHINEPPGNEQILSVHRIRWQSQHQRIHWEVAKNDDPMLWGWLQIKGWWGDFKKRSVSSQVCLKQKSCLSKKKGAQVAAEKKRVEQGNNKRPERIPTYLFAVPLSTFFFLGCATFRGIGRP